MKNINGVDLVVLSVHLRTDRIGVLNHTFRRPMPLDKARAVVRRITKGHKIWNCMLENGNRFWPL
jgi:hypothetical protein